MPFAAPIVAALTPEVLTATSLAATAAGIGTSVYSASQQAKATDAEVRAQQQAEAARRQAMELDARRKQLDIIRTAQRTRAFSLANATNSGSQFGSGLQGAYGQTSGQSTNNLLGVDQSLSLGRDVFSANAAYSNAELAKASAGTIGYIGAGLSSFGSSLMQATPSLVKLGRTYGSGYSQQPQYNPAYPQGAYPY